MPPASINHIGIATDSLDKSTPIWKALGFNIESEKIVYEQGVKVRYLNGTGHTRIELLEPISKDTPVGRFIDIRGVGVQQIAIDVDDIDKSISILSDMGAKMINEEPIIGSEGNRIAFIHPSSCGGVLIELIERQ